MPEPASRPLRASPAADVPGFPANGPIRGLQGDGVRRIDRRPVLPTGRNRLNRFTHHVQSRDRNAAASREGTTGRRRACRAVCRRLPGRTSARCSATCFSAIRVNAVAALRTHPLRDRRGRRQAHQPLADLRSVPTLRQNFREHRWPDPASSQSRDRPPPRSRVCPAPSPACPGRRWRIPQAVNQRDRPPARSRACPVPSPRCPARCWPVSRRQSIRGPTASAESSLPSAVAALPGRCSPDPAGSQSRDRPPVRSRCCPRPWRPLREPRRHGHSDMATRPSPHQRHQTSRGR